MIISLKIKNTILNLKTLMIINMIPRMRLLNLNEQIITYKQCMSITRPA